MIEFRSLLALDRSAAFRADQITGVTFSLAGGSLWALQLIVVLTGCGNGFAFLNQRIAGSAVNITRVAIFYAGSSFGVYGFSPGVHRCDVAAFRASLFTAVTNKSVIFIYIERIIAL